MSFVETYPDSDINLAKKWLQAQSIDMNLKQKPDSRNLLEIRDKSAISYLKKLGPQSQNSLNLKTLKPRSKPQV